GIGAMTLSLDARIGLGLDPANPDVLRIGTAPNHEFVTVTKLSEPRAAAPDGGVVVLERPLERSYTSGAEVQRVTVAADTSVQGTLTLLDAPHTATELLVADGSNYANGNTVRVTLPSGDRLYHVIDTVADAAPGSITLDV